ncbi:FkbM family methyltransferase [Planktothrix sp. FACHB-1355]|uniref:FkbM family methyltransferase n=2 Tax=Aerosakkonema funiforme TaxID=1246630 RepID=A0A926VAH8_9CYAN|nr:FkbM family methyltransferase [Planktothrix sp. FACHB-1355]MBD2179793.1 FkbM family methyltransferase [Aerosakkonema funiforme FACHB-1375]MBD3562716.1 FkbM family methyltransferase [Planktothrix sp. FACHB-1355]
MKTVKKINYFKNLLLRSNFNYYRMAMARPPYWIAANGKTCQVFAGNDLGSATCYGEVIVQDCYDIFKWSKDLNPSVIVDIGANVGMFSKLCSLLFPDADIYAYEPNPMALSWLEQNAKMTNIKVFPYAVTDRTGVVMLDTKSDSTNGQIGAEGNLPVNCISASEVASGRKIDLLKMDCEGSEWSIFQNTELLKRTQNFCMEYHLFDKQTIQELQELIERSGHRIVRISPQENWQSTVGILWSTQL